MDRPRQRHNRIRLPEIAPRMSARPAQGHFKSPAAQRFCDNRVGAGAINHHARSDRVFPLRFGKNVAHPAQIAFAFLAHVANKQQLRVGGNSQSSRRIVRRRHSEHRHDPGGIVGNARPVKPSPVLPDIEHRAGRETRYPDAR